MILGALLVLVTWAGAILAIAVLGLAPALIGRHGLALGTISRMALWWGLLVATGAILVINLLVPLRSPPAAWAFALALAFMAAAAFAVYRRRGGLPGIDLSLRGRRWLAPLFLALALTSDTTKGWRIVALSGARPPNKLDRHILGRLDVRGEEDANITVLLPLVGQRGAGVNEIDPVAFHLINHAAAQRPVLGPLLTQFHSGG